MKRDERKPKIPQVPSVSCSLSTHRPRRRGAHSAAGGGGYVCLWCVCSVLLVFTCSCALPCGLQARHLPVTCPLVARRLPVTCPSVARHLPVT